MALFHSSRTMSSTSGGFGPAILIIVVFVLAMTALVRRASAPVQPEAPSLDFGGAHWVQYPKGSDVLYLRRAFVVAEAPVRAWVQVAALDSFELFLNGRRIGRERSIGSWPSGVYDVSGLLRVGRNTLALKATSTTFGTTGRAIGTLHWVGRTGAVEQLQTDGSWRAERRQRFSGLGTTAWWEPTFYDADWVRAELLPPADVVFIPPALPPAAASEDPRGVWIWHDDRTSMSAAFERTVEVGPKPIQRAWLAVATLGTFQLEVNDDLLGPFSTTDGRMMVIDIGSSLQRGTNLLRVHVHGIQRPMRVAIRGQLESRTSTTDISSDARWRSSQSDRSVIELGAIANDPPTLSPAHGAEASSLPRRWVPIITTFAMLCLLVAGLGVTHVLAMGEHQSLSRRWLGFCQPLVFTMILMGGLQLIEWDPRFSVRWIEQFWLPVVTLAIIAIWLIILQLDAVQTASSRDRRPR